MKRFAASALLTLLAALALTAAVWDGSAVAGGPGDFPGDGLYGACNSFPRDTTVTITNLENGKTVSVTVTRGMDNPGVFIALSPKAAAELGMRAGSAARIRASAMTASQAEATLPPARAGETADPDFNPKVYVDREKAAVKAAAATPSSAASPAAVAAVLPEAPAQTEPQIVPEPSPAPVAGTGSESPAPTDAAQAAEATPAEAPRAREPNPQADTLAIPDTSPSAPGSPKPAPLALSLPSPDQPPIPAESAPSLRGGELAQVPEIVGGALTQPRRAIAARPLLTDPGLPALATSHDAPGPSEKASVSALSRPIPPATSSELALEEPSLAPEELPESVLSRLTAPAMISPRPLLAEAETPDQAAVSEEGPETLAFERPSYTDQRGETDLAEAAPVAPGKDAEAPSAIADSLPGPAPSALAELGEPETPVPSESLSAEHPSATAPELALAELAEPAASIPETATALAAEQPAKAASPAPELASPTPPSPSESLGVERPAAPTAGTAVESVTLEPAPPRPPVAAAAPAAAAPSSALTTAVSQPAAVAPPAVASVKGRSPVGALEAPASIPLLKGLSKGSFYVQIGVYGTNDSLQSAIGGFRSTYPLAVEGLTTKAGSSAYRLFVGPLSRDESGVVLMRIRSLGFKDAYVRQGS